MPYATSPSAGSFSVQRILAEDEEMLSGVMPLMTGGVTS